ncbi:hypothetical protein OROGR_008401 [Orobanche gracilis]
MAVSFSSIPQASSVFAAYASISSFIMLVQTMLNQVVPRHVQHYLLDVIRHYLRLRRDCATIVIEERDGISSNEVYTAVETYLCTKIRPNIDRLKISKHNTDTGLSVGFSQCEKITDTYEGIPLEWRFVNQKAKKPSEVIDENTATVLVETEKRFFELSFEKQHKETVLDLYVPLVMEMAKSIRDETKKLKLHTMGCESQYSNSIVWKSVNLQHPSTFDTLAMEPSSKNAIIEDMDRFVRRKDFYRKVGKAWKRGYLLYGPPGTGKSSLIAAMANYLKFDIYDLELTNIKRDSDLRKLLLRTANRSILVIEDIDCSVELPDRKGKRAAPPPAAAAWDGKYYDPSKEKFTLSGLLNFIDGLWSSCGDERIVVFTTNDKDKLDPALLRAGRMDMHIHMSYLTPGGFHSLASTYLDVDKHHPGLSEIEDLIKNVKVTPAEVAEELMTSDDADGSLQGLLAFLHAKKKDMEEEKIKDARSVEDGDGDGDGDRDGDEKGGGVVMDEIMTYYEE